MAGTFFFFFLVLVEFLLVSFSGLVVFGFVLVSFSSRRRAL